MPQNRHNHLKLSIIALSAIAVVPAAGQLINEDLKFIASDAAEFDVFGWSIAIDNGIIAVGAAGDDDNGISSGSAYLFDASTGAQLFKLLPSDGAAGVRFGTSIAIDNGVVAVGAYRDNDRGIHSGSAYLFDTSTGAQLFKLLPSDGAANDRFGLSIAIDNGVVAIGSYKDDDNGGDSGSAYLFNASTGDQITKLLPNDGAAGDIFGTSIAIDNGIVAVGAVHNTDSVFESGSAYLFNAITGDQITKLAPSDGVFNGDFGRSIDIDNGIVVVGAPGDDDNGIDSGSAYLFDASTGDQLFKILPSDGVRDDVFGNSSAIDNGIVAVGAYNDGDNGSGSGSAYLFDASTGVQITKLLSSDGDAEDFFGRSIAFDNDVIAAGAAGDDYNGFNAGSVYVFNTHAPCPADLTNDGILNFFDISAFLNAFSTQDPIADFNNDGLFNFFDVSEFLTLFNAGCP